MESFSNKTRKTAISKEWENLTRKKIEWLGLALYSIDQKNWIKPQGRARIFPCTMYTMRTANAWNQCDTAPSGTNVAKVIKWFISSLYRNIDFLRTPRRMISSLLWTFFLTYVQRMARVLNRVQLWESARRWKKMFGIVLIFSDFPVKKNNVSRNSQTIWPTLCTASLLFSALLWRLKERKKVHTWMSMCMLSVCRSAYRV